MKLLLIEDHPLFRLGVRELAAKRWPAGRVVEAGNMAEAESALRRESFDVVALDLSLPDASGVEAVARTIAAARGAPVVVVSASAEGGSATHLLKRGVAGFVSKERAGETLVEAIERVAAGGRFVSPELAERLVDMLSGRAGAAPPHETLSSQEHRVMRLIAAGLGPTEIAERMSLSVKTVGTYRFRILEKGGWANNTELTKYCIKHGLTDD